MFKTLNNLASSYLTDSFTLTSSVHNRNRRSVSNNDLYIPRPNTEMFRRSFAYRGAKLWNDLPCHIRNAKTLQEFKRWYLTF